MTAEGQLQCSFLTIFSACSAAPRDIEVSNACKGVLDDKLPSSAASCPEAPCFARAADFSNPPATSHRQSRPSVGPW